MMFAQRIANSGWNMINLACGLLRWSALPSILLTQPPSLCGSQQKKRTKAEAGGCSDGLLENAFLLVVPQSQDCGVAEVKLQYMVDILSDAKLSHPFSLPQFAKGISIIFYLFSMPYGPQGHRPVKKQQLGQEPQHALTKDALMVLPQWNTSLMQHMVCSGNALNTLTPCFPWPVAQEQRKG